jgi:diadenylate cyclase
MNPSQLSRFWETVRSNFSWISIIDILAVTAIIYLLLRLVRHTRAVQLLKGLGMLLVLILITDTLGLTSLNWLLSQTLLPGVIALIILFQPELRLALERLGRGRFWGGGGLGVQGQAVVDMVNELVRFARESSAARTGVLVVIERSVGLGDVARTGRQIEGPVTAELLGMIFAPGSPLHDLAVLIRGNRVVAAGCMLPLSETRPTGASRGTRHRAALGLSERTDAVVLVVSEQTGMVSLACEGRLATNLTDETIRRRLIDLLSPPPKEPWTHRLWKRNHATP